MFGVCKVEVAFHKFCSMQLCPISCYVCDNLSNLACAECIKSSEMEDGDINIGSPSLLQSLGGVSKFL